MAFQNNPTPAGQRPTGPIKPAASGAAGVGSMPKSKRPGNLGRVLNRDEEGNVPLGANQYAGPSSVTDVTKTPTMSGLDISAPHGDDALDIVKSKGMGSNYQTRSISAEPYATHPGMKGPSSGARVPLSNVRRANDGLLRRTK